MGDRFRSVRAEPHAPREANVGAAGRTTPSGPHPFSFGVSSMHSLRTRWLVLAAVAAGGVLVGCNKDNKTEESSSGPPPMAGSKGGPPGMAFKQFDADSEPHAAGKKAMVAARCFNCHAVDGAKPTGGAGGPPGGPGGPPPGGPSAAGRMSKERGSPPPGGPEGGP